MLDGASAGMGALITTLYQAAAIRDAGGCCARPGTVAIEGGRIVAAGPRDDLRPQHFDQHLVIDLPQTLILPAMVNAHGHLAMTSIGPRPYGGDFVGWLEHVMTHRPRNNFAIARSVHEGATQSHHAGVGWVGDIADTPVAVQARRQAGLPGISFLECVGIGTRQSAAIENLTVWIGELTGNRQFGPATTVHLGLQPHAPYSAGLDLYRAATDLASPGGLPLATHLAETVAEVQFVRDGAGPFVALLRRLGKWDDSIQPTHQHPIEWLDPVLQHGRWLLAHCNYVQDRHIELLARRHVSVIYCPISSEYFQHQNHRYRDMLAAGVNVGIGTDSILCQDPRESQPLGVMPQIRRLFARDRTDPDMLLAMATVNGASALGLPSTHSTLAVSAPAHLVTVQIDPDDPTDPLTQALRSRYPVRPLTIVEARS